MYTNYKAVLLSLMATWSVKAADFDWEVAPIDGYPQIGFNNGTKTKEAVFLYNYTGTIIPNTKYLQVTLLDSNCTNPADASLAFEDSIKPGNQFEVDLNIIEETITTSNAYTENADGTKATIDFCMRVDYEFNDGTTTESINFHETTVTINVDLTANFSLTSITVNRTAADENQANATLDYPVQAYFCQDDNGEVSQPVLAQGSLLQFCVKIDDSVTAAVYVEDILEFTLSQPDAVPAVAASKPIVATTPDPLTEKLCREMGICNIRHQLSSKWFAVPRPEPLRIDGVAVLSFGIASMMPSAAPTGAVRRLRAPIRGLLSAEQAQAIMDRQLAMEAEAAEAAANSQVAIYNPRALQATGGAPTTGQQPFDLQVPLVSSNTQATGSTGGSNTGVVVGVIIAVVIVAAILTYFFCCKKRKEKHVEEHHKVVTTSATQQSYQDAPNNGSGNYSAPVVAY